VNDNTVLRNPALPPNVDPGFHTSPEHYDSPRIMRRAHFAALSVVPGALLLMMVVAIELPEGGINFLVTCFLGLILTVAICSIAYAMVDAAPRAVRTWIAATIAVAVNLAYLVILGVLSLM